MSSFISKAHYNDKFIQTKTSEIFFFTVKHRIVLNRSNFYFFFCYQKSWLAFETSYGTEESRAHVMQQAEDYVKDTSV
jgi:hypothetical protein